MVFDYISDKSWMYVRPRQRVEDVYVDGVKCFTKFAFEHRPEGSRQIRCPCKKCENMHWRDKNTVEFHIVGYGFIRDYTCWHFYGESRKRFKEEDLVVLTSGDIIKELLHDAWRGPFPFKDMGPSESANRQGRNRNAEKFEVYIEDRVIHKTGPRSIMRAKEKWVGVGESYHTMTGYSMAHKKQKGTQERRSAKSRRNSLSHSAEPSVLSPTLDMVFHRHHGGYKRDVRIGYLRRLMCESDKGHSGNEPSNHLQLVIEELKAKNKELLQRLHVVERGVEEMLRGKRGKIRCEKKVRAR